MTVVTHWTSVREDYLQKLISKGGNIWFPVRNSEGKRIKTEDRYFGVGVNIYPKKDDKGEVYWVISLQNGSGYQKKYSGPKREVEPKPTPAKIDTKQIGE